MTSPPPDLLDTLHDPIVRTALDPHDMMRLVLDFAEQCRRASEIEWQNVPLKASGIQQVIFAGVGGSAIGADFVRSLMEASGRVPMFVNRDYSLPAWAGPETLVICGSYSGNTEETLAAYAEARRVGAQIAVVSSGGELTRRAEADGLPIARVPGGQPPRSATGFMFFPTLRLLSESGLLDGDFTPDTTETLVRLQTLAHRFGPDVATPHNAAKQLAVALYGKIPVLYGSQGWRGAVAIRWKGQFNENAKQAAFANVLPEQNHNEILAWVNAPRQASNWAVLFLRDPQEAEQTPRIALRVDVTKSLVAPIAPTHDIWAEGDSLLARIFTLAHYADYVTVYLAFLNGCCPTEIGLIDHLKTELAKVG